MAKNNSKLVTKVSPLIEGQVPGFVQSDHPKFVNFLKIIYQSYTLVKIFRANEVF